MSLRAGRKVDVKMITRAVMRKEVVDTQCAVLDGADEVRVAGHQG